VRRLTTRRSASRRLGDNFWKVNRANGGAATGKSNLVSFCGFVTRRWGCVSGRGVAMILRWRREGRTEREWIVVSGGGEKCSSPVSTPRVSFSSRF